MKQVGKYATEIQITVLAIMIVIILIITEMRHHDHEDPGFHDQPEVELMQYQPPFEVWT